MPDDSNTLLNKPGLIDTYAPQPHLNGKHSVFGQLISGMDVLKTIENGDTIAGISIEER